MLACLFIDLLGLPLGQSVITPSLKESKLTRAGVQSLDFPSPHLDSTKVPAQQTTKKYSTDMATDP